MSLDKLMGGFLGAIADAKRESKEAKEVKGVVARNLGAILERKELFSSLVACTLTDRFEKDGELVVNRVVDCQRLYDKLGGGDDVYAALYAGKSAHPWSIFTRQVLTYARQHSASHLAMACKGEGIDFTWSPLDKDVQLASFRTLGQLYGFGTTPTKVVSAGKGNVVDANSATVAEIRELLRALNG